MATRATTVTNPEQHIGRTSVLAVTAGMLNGDDSTPVESVSQYDRLSVQVSGTFGVGGSVAVEGSHDGSTWFALPGVNGTAIAITAAGGAVVAMDSCGVRKARCRVTAGDGTTSLTTSIYLRK